MSVFAAVGLYVCDVVDGGGGGGGIRLLVSKIQDEVKALQLCQSKVRAKKLPMEVIDAEYQW